MELGVLGASLNADALRKISISEVAFYRPKQVLKRNSIVNSQLSTQHVPSTNPVLSTFSIICLCVYVCVCVSALECGCSRGQEEGIRFHGAGVIEGCESPV